MLIRIEEQAVHVKIWSFDRLFNRITRIVLLSMRRVDLSSVRLQGLRVRKSPVTYMSLSYEYCMFSCRGLCDG